MVTLTLVPQSDAAATGEEHQGERMSSSRRLSLLTAASALANLAPSMTTMTANNTDLPVVDCKAYPPRGGVSSAPVDDDADDDEAARREATEQEFRRSNEQDLKNLRKRFPEVLMDILSYEPAKNMIKWLPDGKSFLITEPFDLASEILPKFFKVSQFESFVRKLNRWGFRRVARGKSAGSFYHAQFLRDDPELCRKMKNRPSVPSNSGGRTSAATIGARNRQQQQQQHHEQRQVARRQQAVLRGMAQQQHRQHPSKQVAAAFAADAAHALGLRPGGVGHPGVRGRPMMMEDVDAHLNHAKRARLAAAIAMKMKLHPNVAGADAMKLRMAQAGLSPPLVPAGTCSAAAAMKLLPLCGGRDAGMGGGGGGAGGFSLKSHAMNLDQTREMLRNNNFGGVPFPSSPSRGRLGNVSSPSSPSLSSSSSSRRVPASKRTVVHNKPDVKAAFLRHQRLLVRTQESRAMLQSVGLMAKPQSC